ncbi:MAG: hypothetical protein OEW02_10075 [Myxococcales bacterium]|nr:hypothetical protein [Myxococcales bacterium]MDH5566946.1 hypothetical protein [Myxococcales bacterium]
MRTACAIGCAIGALLLAAAGTAETDATTRRFEGEVVKMDAAKRTLVVKPVGEGSHDAGHYTFALKSDAEITAKGQKKQLGDLGVGDRVAVTYREARGIVMATRVEILAKPRPVSAMPKRPVD